MRYTTPSSDSRESVKRKAILLCSRYFWSSRNSISGVGELRDNPSNGVAAKEIGAKHERAEVRLKISSPSPISARCRFALVLACVSRSLYHRGLFAGLAETFHTDYVALLGFEFSCASKS